MNAEPRKFAKKPPVPLGGHDTGHDGHVAPAPEADAEDKPLIFNTEAESLAHEDAVQNEIDAYLIALRLSEESKTEKLAKAEWNEEDHERDDKGRFGSGGFNPNKTADGYKAWAQHGGGMKEASAWVVAAGKDGKAEAERISQAAEITKADCGDALKFQKEEFHSFADAVAAENPEAKDWAHNAMSEIQTQFEHHQGSTYSIDKSAIPVIDHMFLQAGIEMAEDTIVHRGLKLDPDIVKDMVKAIDSGKTAMFTHYDNRYVCTSPLREVAERFARGGGGGEYGVMFHVMMPQGSTFVMPSAFTKSFMGETEMTLPRGARFNVVGHRTITTKEGHPRTEFIASYTGSALTDLHGELGKAAASGSNPDEADIDAVEWIGTIDPDTGEIGTIHGEQPKGFNPAADLSKQHDATQKWKLSRQKVKPKTKGTT